MESRLAELEERISNVRVNNASLTTSVEHLAESVKNLTIIVQQLRDTMNQGRGALWVITGAAAMLGAIVAMAAKKFLGV